MNAQIKTQSHTPGPWSVGNARVAKYATGTSCEIAIHVGEGSKRGNCLAIVYMGGDGAIRATESHIEANAKLIAAAPDMAEALQAMLRARIDPMGIKAYEADMLARAALAKAGL